MNAVLFPSPLSLPSLFSAHGSLFVLLFDHATPPYFDDLSITVYTDQLTSACQLDSITHVVVLIELIPSDHREPLEARPLADHALT